MTQNTIEKGVNPKQSIHPKYKIIIRLKFSENSYVKGWNICSQVIVEGVRGSGYKGDIAVDDLNIVDGPCAGKLLVYSSFLFCTFKPLHA